MPRRKRIPVWRKDQRLMRLSDLSDMGLKTPPELNAITDVVLAYRPKPKTKAAKRRAKRKRQRDGKKGSRESCI